MTQKFTETLPRSAWQNVVINENNEPLVLVSETDKLKIGIVNKEYKTTFYVRKAVAEKLYLVSGSLPDGICLVLIEGYRSTQNQQNSWDNAFNLLKMENPTYSDEQINKKVGLVVAKPLPLANHHCGGAVDVTLMYSNGILIDMGTPYPSHAMSADYYKKFQMLSNDISNKQKKNRKILREAMEIAGFVWYPGEWWHYCWGDRMWAVYSGNTECYYGSIELLN